MTDRTSAPPSRSGWPGWAPGDEVITTTWTFTATAGAIEAAGATPILVDVEAVLLNIDPPAVRAATTSRTTALVPVQGAFPVADAAMERSLSLPFFAGLEGSAQDRVITALGELLSR